MVGQESGLGVGNGLLCSFVMGRGQGGEGLGFVYAGAWAVKSKDCFL